MSTNCLWNTWLTLFFTLSAACEARPEAIEDQGNTASSEITLVCSWDSFPSNHESFVINPAKSTAYWVNEDSHLQVLQLNAGRIVMKGTKAKVQTGSTEFISNVTLKFTINRISGELGVQWLAPEFSLAKLGNYESGKIYTRGCKVQRLF